MPAISYPAPLPPPSQGLSFTLRDRAARSSLAPAAGQARQRSSDAIADVSGAQWLYSASEMPVWRAWWKDTLREGQLWFAAELPGAGGMVTRVVRYRPGTLRVVPVGGGHCRVSADLEVRGRSLAPQV